MSPYITFKDYDKDNKLQYYILQREYPHFCGVISYFPVGDSLCQIPVTGHHLYVTFAGTLRGNGFPAHNMVEQEIQSIFHHMATWFYINRIEADPKRYKKWVIKS